MWSIAIRAIVGLDLVLIALSFTRWFSGDADHAGLADHLFRPISGNGFRLDFLYILLSSLFALVICFVNIRVRPLKDHEKIDAALCLIAVFAAITLVRHILLG